MEGKVTTLHDLIARYLMPGALLHLAGGIGGPAARSAAWGVRNHFRHTKAPATSTTANSPPSFQANGIGASRASWSTRATISRADTASYASRRFACAARLAASLLAEGRAQRIYLFIAPFTLGEEALPARPGHVEEGVILDLAADARVKAARGEPRGGGARGGGVRGGEDEGRPIGGSGKAPPVGRRELGRGE